MIDEQVQEMTLVENTKGWEEKQNKHLFKIICSNSPDRTHKHFDWNHCAFGFVLKLCIFLTEFTILNNTSREKLVHAILYFAKTTKCPPLVKMFKLLFFLDFCHFKESGRAVTGLDYRALPFGPVPINFYDEIKDGNVPDDMKEYFGLVPLETERSTPAFQFKPKRKPDTTVFTPREQKILKNVANIFRDATPTQMSEISHLKNQPWDKTIKEKGLNALIDYLLALDADAKVSVDDAKEFLKERHEMLTNFIVKPKLAKAK